MQTNAPLKAERRPSLLLGAIALAAMLACDEGETDHAAHMDAATGGGSMSGFMMDAGLVPGTPDSSIADGAVAPLPADAGALPGNDAPIAEPPIPDDALYILHSASQDDQGTRTNAFSLVDSLLTRGLVGATPALALPGRARLYAQPGFPFFAVGDSESLTLTRYDLGAGDVVNAGASISLQPFGVTALAARAVHFVSETKAYYKDPDQAQIIVWNPSTMKVERSIELPADAIKTDHQTNLSDWIVRDGQAYFAVSWTSTAYDRVHPGTKLVRIDTQTDEITVTDDARCRGLNKTASFDGALYFFSDVINAFGHAVYPGEGGQADCVLRINQGATTFDPSYVGSLAPALRADQAATIIDVTADGTAWAQVVDLNVAPTTPGSTYSEWYAAGWRWYRAPLATLTGPQPVTEEAGAYSGFTFTTGPHFLIAQTEEDYSETTLVDLSQGAPQPGISFAGFALGIARLR